MLAQNFMKPEALGISEAEVTALIRILGRLERGELIHDPNAQCFYNGKGEGFRMSGILIQQDCGTTACIAGWVQVLSGIRADVFIGRSDATYKLCCPGGNLDDITTAHAAIALRNYLATGEPRWREALASE